MSNLEQQIQCNKSNLILFYSFINKLETIKLLVVHYFFSNIKKKLKIHNSLEFRGNKSLLCLKKKKKKKKKKK